jgi:hypothetical protein
VRIVQLGSVYDAVDFLYAVIKELEGDETMRAELEMVRVNGKEGVGGEEFG